MQIVRTTRKIIFFNSIKITYLLWRRRRDSKRSMFHDYLARYAADELREALLRLFDVLDTDYSKRSKYLSPVLAAFPYVNGGLFHDTEIEIPLFTDELRDILLMKASYGFDWSKISPTIFGAVFESTLNPTTRRSGGMHYTSILLLCGDFEKKVSIAKQMKTNSEAKSCTLSNGSHTNRLTF